MRRPVHEGQKPRRLHESATTISWPHRVRRASPGRAPLAGALPGRAPRIDLTGHEWFETFGPEARVAVDGAPVPAGRSHREDLAVYVIDLLPDASWVRPEGLPGWPRPAQLSAPRNVHFFEQTVACGMRTIIDPMTRHRRSLRGCASPTSWPTCGPPASQASLRHDRPQHEARAAADRGGLPGSAPAARARRDGRPLAGDAHLRQSIGDERLDPLARHPGRHRPHRARAPRGIDSDRSVARARSAEGRGL